MTLRHSSKKTGTLTWELPPHLDERCVPASVKIEVEEQLMRVARLYIYALSKDESCMLRLLDNLAESIGRAEAQQIWMLCQIQRERRPSKKS
jgi:hypothetical protein